MFSTVVLNFFLALCPSPYNKLNNHWVPLTLHIEQVQQERAGLGLWETLSNSTNMTQGSTHTENEDSGWGGPAAKGGRRICQGSLTVQTGTMPGHDRKTWNTTRLPGKIFRIWQEADSASSSEPTMMFFPHPRTWTKTSATLWHILTGCKASQAQGRQAWRQNQVLWQLVINLEGVITFVNAKAVKCCPFANEDQLPVNPSTRVTPTLPDPAWVWKMQVDLDHKLTFPPEIIIT